MIYQTVSHLGAEDSNCLSVQRNLKVLYLMNFEMFVKHREITYTVVLKHFDFGGDNYLYGCNLVRFSASDLLNCSTSSKTKE